MRPHFLFSPVPCSSSCWIVFCFFLVVMVFSAADVYAQTGRLRRLPLCTGYGQFLDNGWNCEPGFLEYRECYDVPPARSFIIRPPRWERWDMVWPDGTTLYRSELWCELDFTFDLQDPGTSMIEGRIISQPSGSVDRRILADIQGGFVEHIRHAYVRGEIRLARLHSGVERDLTLAIQILENDGWNDHLTRRLTTSGSFQTYVIEGYVPPLTDVRLQVRADTPRSSGSNPYLYSAEDGGIFVEQCVPDPGNPGECIGCSAAGNRSGIGLAGMIVFALFVARRRKRSRRRGPESIVGAARCAPRGLARTRPGPG
jgi:hypothetical protein